MNRHVLLFAFCCILPSAAAQEQVEDQAAIRRAVESYVNAFNRHDANSVAAHWSADAVYTSRVTGEQVTGRQAIEQLFESQFQEAKDAKLDVSVEAIQFVSPNVAVEHGTANLLRPNLPPEELQYTAVHVRRDGKWLLDRVTDEDEPVVKSHYEQLKELEWMIGSWIDEDDNASVVTECQWTRNNNFITRSFTVSVGDQIDMAGMQIVGWDPAAKQIRSWTFDSDGGFSEGKWTRKDDRWFIHKTGVLHDGGQATAVNVMRLLDDNTCTLQSVSRTVDGELLPNIDEIRIVRQ